MNSKINIVEIVLGEFFMKLAVEERPSLYGFIKRNEKDGNFEARYYFNRKYQGLLIGNDYQEAKEKLTDKLTQLYDGLKENLKHIKLFEDMNPMKNIYVLVGPPSIGKSTWVSNTFKDTPPFIISRDDIVDEVADEYGLTYDEMFSAPPSGSTIGEIHSKFGKVIQTPTREVHDVKFAKLIYDKVWEANNEVYHRYQERMKEARGKDNIVIDRTNMTPKERKEAFEIIEGIEDQYHKVAVVFTFKGIEEIIKKVNLKRAEELKKLGRYKTIPGEVFNRMFSRYQEVGKDEGFDEIINIDNSEALRRISQNENLKHIKPFNNFK